MCMSCIIMTGSAVSLAGSGGPCLTSEADNSSEGHSFRVAWGGGLMRGAREGDTGWQEAWVCYLTNMQGRRWSW